MQVDNSKLSGYETLAWIFAIFAFAIGCNPSLSEIEEKQTTLSDTQYNTTEEPELIPITDKLKDTEENLDNWLGKYSYGEENPSPDDIRGFGINEIVKISKSNGKYYAEILENGYQQGTHMKALVQGTSLKIDFIFEEYFADNMFDTGFKKGDLLLRFETKDDKLLTWWGTIEPAYYKNFVQGKEYFQYLDIE